jgi:hypothetical protein
MTTAGKGPLPSGLYRMPGSCICSPASARTFMISSYPGWAGAAEITADTKHASRPRQRMRRLDAAAVLPFFFRRFHHERIFQPRRVFDAPGHCLDVRRQRVEIEDVERAQALSDLGSQARPRRVHHHGIGPVPGASGLDPPLDSTAAILLKRAPSRAPRSPTPQYRSAQVALVGDAEDGNARNAGGAIPHEAEFASGSGSSASSGSPRRWSGSSPAATTSEVSPGSSARTPRAAAALARREPRLRTRVLPALQLQRFPALPLLLRLPHKQFVFTPWSGRCTDLPKVLRVFFRHDKGLHGEISRLIYALVRDFTTEAAGKPVRTADVVVFQSSGSFCRFHNLPKVDLQKMSAWPVHP